MGKADIQFTPLPPTPTITGVDVSKVTKLNSTPPTFKTNWTKGDGNCMFIAFARAYPKPMFHTEVRGRAVQWIRAHPEDFVPFLPFRGGVQMTLDQYLGHMSQDGIWGDNLMLQAACKALLVTAMVLKKENKAFTWMGVNHQPPERTVLWFYLTRYHYENLLLPKHVVIDM